MHRPSARRALIVSIAMLGALALAGPAAAAKPPTAPNHRITQSTSTNWSGYAVSGHGPYTSVSSSWTVPSVTCSGTSYSSFWVGLDGDTTGTVEQTGTDSDCNGGTPVYYGWYEMYPKFPVNFSNPVSPGDTMTASVTAGSRGSFTLVLADTTKNWTQTIGAQLKRAQLGSAEVIAEAPSSSGGVLPLADFGIVNFGASTVNGSSLASLPGLDPITMVTSSGTVKAAPGKIATNGSFSDTWHHA